MKKVEFSASPDGSQVDEAFEFFLRRAGAQTLQNLRSVVIKLELPDWTAGRRKLVCSLVTLTQLVPHVRYKILSSDWGLFWYADDLFETLEEFVSQGRKNL
ncbi:hypothetical protein HBI56_069520 [Parastagonospora nodorum]|uniref:Uncharacterized protein n=2 Tax=Phaeosphaeria nodorum (strain SN15 / ATCC MYA-4574 / FGSC 10173) TaxID=321614 RepID=A0A7U2ENX0_PHANO|nr:hypothetical protein SNOG_09712 [Parastagonospora nodorum SN15]KAH3920400.1 hypothetical protein HBH56_003970 [Parastagonospora nodorum]EAT82977.2 hypothetical protein SNOG_09712 [Parastagonospora nodorum SN15]KAH3937852.1 hypothetical protein HBH54_003960 [Parastagonospora nodorum]KAH3946536.1 hypothetical protein HBH53_128030 [Parastagonospora nodorum]KAH3975126.1 hypothetical protein HBH51_086720 [Parastagonospora nodorum]